MGVVPGVHAAASLKQVAAGAILGSAKSFSLSFPQNTGAGDTIVVGFDFDTLAAFSSISDSQGNTFTEVGAQLTSPGGARIRVYGAKSIAGGPDTVTITLSANSSFIEVYLTEYSGLDPTNPIDAQSGASGNAGPVSSGSATTTVAGDIIYGYCVGDGTCTVGSGFTARSTLARSTLNNSLLEDTTAGNPGSYAATGTGNNGWAIQMVALKPALVVAPPVITSSDTVNATVGTAFSYQITATNSPTSFGASGLPAGLTVNTASGLISGTPTGAGTSNVTVSATNSGGTGSAPLTLTIAVAAPVITSSGTASATVGTAFSYQITATNSPTSFGASGFPVGLTVNTASGLISGTPTGAGTSNVTVSATNSGGTGSAPLTLTIAVAPPVITSSGNANATVGTAFSYQITATNSPTSFGASGLPAGLTVNTASGLISGTPTGAGNSTVTLSATNSGGTGSAPLTLTISGGGTTPLVSHTIQISSDADDGYYNNYDNSGWHSSSQYGGADLVGSWAGTTTSWVTGYRFPSVGINSGDTIRSAYLKLISSDGFAGLTCGEAPCPSYTFRVYGVAQDNGVAFSGTAGNTPLDVPHTTAYTDYTTTGPGDVHGSCQGNNNGQNTCSHIIDVTNIVKEITSRPGWTNTSAMRFVMLSMDNTAPNVYVGFEDYSANASKAATLVVNPPVPTIVSSGAWGTSASASYPTTYRLGGFVYPGASTLLLFLGDYYNFYNQSIAQPSVSDSCGNTWNILAGPTNWVGISYDVRSTVYYVQNPAACPAGDLITVTVNNQEPIFLHFLAVAGSDTAHAPIVSAITSPSPGTYTTSATSNSITLSNAGLLVSWIFGDSDAPHTFTSQTGFLTDMNSTPTYLTAAFASVSSPGAYQSQFSISPSSDGWQVVMIGLQAPSQ